MAAYLVGQITVKDETLWQQYMDGVRESLIPFDAAVLFRGERDSVLAGENEYDLVVAIEFAELSVLHYWYRSDKYQSIIPLRDRAADVVITAYEAPRPYSL